MQPTNLKDTSFLDTLKILNANLQIVVAFRMLPKVVWQMPAYGTFNLHASLLPNYRGAAPINWAIINGETKTGVSTFFIDEKIDTGAMILQKDIAITPEENVGTLHDKLMHLGSHLVLETVSLIEKGEVNTTPQTQEGNLKTAYKLNKDNCKIDWNATLEDIHNKIRGLSPYPAAWSTLVNGEDLSSVKVYAAEKEVAEHPYNTGKIITSKKTLKVAVKGGYISILKLKLAGKKLMDAPALLNGYSFNENAEMR